MRGCVLGSIHFQALRDPPVRSVNVPGRGAAILAMWRRHVLESQRERARFRRTDSAERQQRASGPRSIAGVGRSGRICTGACLDDSGCWARADSGQSSPLEPRFWRTLEAIASGERDGDPFTLS
jgi:hypothetical protein